MTTRRITAQHRADHELIRKRIAEDWLGRDTLLIHLARDHGVTAQDLDGDYGLVPLIAMHESGHGVEDVLGADAVLAPNVLAALNRWGRGRDEDGNPID